MPGITAADSLTANCRGSRIGQTFWQRYRQRLQLVARPEASAPEDMGKSARVLGPTAGRARCAGWLQTLGVDRSQSTKYRRR